MKQNFNDKRPVMLLATLYFLIGFVSLLLLLMDSRMCMAYGVKLFQINSYDISPFFLLGIFLKILWPFVLMATSIGIFLFRNWARKIALLITFYPFFFAMYTMAMHTKRVTFFKIDDIIKDPSIHEKALSAFISDIRILPTALFNKITFMGFIISIIFFVSIFFWFNSPKIKEQFKKSRK